MPVVINELEVSPTAQESGAGSSASAAGSSGAPPDPHEIERALERQMERCARVRAH